MSLNQRGVVNPRPLITTLRIVWAAMLFSLGMYVVVLVRVQNFSVTPLERTAQACIALMGILTGAVVLYLRFIRIAGLISSAEPIDDKTLASQANFNYLLCNVFSEATALFGFVLAFMHGDPNFYVPLYLAGVLLMLLCYPRLPANESR